MDNDDDFEKLLSFHINNEIKKHSAQKVISQEEFIKEIVQKTGLSEEKINEFFRAFNKVIRELKRILKELRTFLKKHLEVILKCLIPKIL